MRFWTSLTIIAAFCAAAMAAEPQFTAEQAKRQAAAYLKKAEPLFQRAEPLERAELHAIAAGLMHLAGDKARAEAWLKAAVESMGRLESDEDRDALRGALTEAYGFMGRPDDVIA